MTRWLTTASACVGLLTLLGAEESRGQNVESLKAGVVKITAQPPEGSGRIGTGFVVRLERDLLYIVTAAHVVAGDPQPTVEFFTRRHVPVRAAKLGAEGGDEIRGMALLVVRGRDTIPAGVTALALAPAVRLSGGEDITVIGFPRGAGPWAVIKGSVVSRVGREIQISAAINEGNSGGPMIMSGQVVGLVGGVKRPYGVGVPAISLQAFLEGFGVMPVLAGAPPEPERQRAVTQPPPVKKQMTGKDGAPMVLIPAGEFMMGSPDGEGDADEHPRHRVVLDDFHMDKYEVTNRLFRKFARETGYRSTAEREGSAYGYTENGNRSTGRAGENRRAPAMCLPLVVKITR